MKNKGFTLIEILVTLGVVLSLALACSISFNWFTRKNEQAVLLNELSAAIQSARMLAVSSGHPLTIEPIEGLDWARGYALTRFNSKTKTNEFVHHWKLLHPYWGLQWSGAGGINKIIVSPDPINAISNGTFTLTNYRTHECKKLVLNRLGRLKIKDDK